LAPWTTLITPGGKPAFSASSIKIMMAPGSSSEGLRMKLLPVIVAIGIYHNGIIAGKSAKAGQLAFIQTGLAQATH
jgi:hypothetical protein